MRWLVVVLAACGSPHAAASDGAASNDAATCTLTADTTATSTVIDGCALRTRDTSSCQSAREQQGLGGFWLKFSCRVTLTVAGATVQLVSDDQPDYLSNYFAASDPCHVAYTTQFPDPNTIAAQHITMTVPVAPSGSASAMSLGAVGMALNGVAIFDNQAAPGDDIFDESGSFDQCQGHPQMQGVYHYHSEPYAISYADDAFIGVMRDGNPIYGRFDPGGSSPTLDAAGGHTSATADSSTPVYHYHLNLQTSTGSATAGDMVWFLTTGQYASTPGSCLGC
ncbi:MAG TPA: YHYH protein [Kofleriaceae bacterium]